MTGTIFLLGGINDVGFVTGGWKRGLGAAGLPHRLEHVRWQHGTLRSRFTFADLRDCDRHREFARQLADRIVAARPHGPVHVVAHSAGTAVAAYALEGLPAAETVRSAIFVGSGLSPGYDLAPVLDRCEKGLLSIDCGTDLLFLGLGTLVFGTADRKRTPAAGLVGFRCVDPRYTALRWRPRDASCGWLGGHLSVAAPGFARTVLAARIRQADGA